MAVSGGHAGTKKGPNWGQVSFGVAGRTILSFWPHPSFCDQNPCGVIHDVLWKPLLQHWHPRWWNRLSKKVPQFSEHYRELAFPALSVGLEEVPQRHVRQTSKRIGKHPRETIRRWSKRSRKGTSWNVVKNMKKWQRQVTTWMIPERSSGLLDKTREQSNREKCP